MILLKYQISQMLCRVNRQMVLLALVITAFYTNAALANNEDVAEFNNAIETTVGTMYSTYSVLSETYVDTADNLSKLESQGGIVTQLSQSFSQSKFGNQFTQKTDAIRKLHDKLLKTDVVKKTKGNSLLLKNNIKAGQVLKVGGKALSIKENIEWGIDTYQEAKSLYEEISEGNAEVENYTDLAMQIVSKTPLGAATDGLVYKKIKDINSRMGQIRQNFSTMETTTSRLLADITGGVYMNNILLRRKGDIERARSQAEIDTIMREITDEHDGLIGQYISGLEDTRDMVANLGNNLLSPSPINKEDATQRINDKLVLIENYKQEWAVNGYFKDKISAGVIDIISADIEQGIFDIQKNNQKIIDSTKVMTQQAYELESITQSASHEFNPQNPPQKNVPEEKKSDIVAKKQEADTLLLENKKRAEEYEALYIQLKNDPENQDLKNRVSEADKLLRESTVNYLEKRNDIRASGESNYGGLANSLDSIRGRIDEKYPDVPVDAQEQILEGKINQEGLVITKDAAAVALVPKSEVNPNLVDEQQHSDTELAQKRQAVDDKSRSQLEIGIELQAKTQKISRINNRINAKKNEIDNLKRRLAELGGQSGNSFSPDDKYLLVRLQYIKRLSDKRNGDISQLNSKERRIMSALGKKLKTPWFKLFKDIDSRYLAAQSQYSSSGSIGDSSDEARSIQRQIDQLQSQVIALSNEIDRVSSYREQILVSYQQGVDELQELINDVNDTAKEQQGDNPVNLPFYGAASYLGDHATNSHIFEGYFAVSTSNDFSADNQNTDFRAGDSNEFITPNINTGSGDHFDGYQYVAWGQWNSNGHQIVEGPNAEHGRTTTEVNSALGGWWALGQEAYDVPTQGQASYSGEIRGDFINASGVAQRGAITGDIGFAVNFGANTISSNGNIKVNNAQIDSFSMNPVNFNNIGGNTGGINPKYWFQMNGAANSGRNLNLAGSLNGKNGSEISGGFQYNDGNSNSVNTGSGVFRAKQQ